MKHIRKQGEPPSFSQWKAQANDDWKPTYDQLSGSVKNDLKKALQAEQGYICCYCERRLTDSDSHIEHFRPQSDPSVDPLDYDNLLCSCQQRVEKGKPCHCGVLKGRWFDANLLVSPFDPGCEKRFAFLFNGEIKGADEKDKAASETIERLGLNIPKLKDLRAKAIEPFLDESLSLEEIQAFVLVYLDQSPNGYLEEFWTTIRYLFQ